LFSLFSQAVIDLLIPGQSPGIKERLVDLYGKPELLFFGPDGKMLYNARSR
jgi:glutamate dehydrogenase